MDEGIFKTVFQAAHNRAQMELNAANQWRMNEAIRRDQMNIATNNALSNALARVTEYQKTLNDREIRMAQAKAAATGQASSAGTPQMQRASEIGAAQRQAQLSDIQRKMAFDLGMEEFEQGQQNRREAMKQRGMWLRQEDAQRHKEEMKAAEEQMRGITLETFINERKVRGLPVDPATRADVERTVEQYGYVPYDVWTRLMDKGRGDIHVDARSFPVPPVDLAAIDRVRQSTQRNITMQPESDVSLRARTLEILEEKNLPESLGIPGGFAGLPKELQEEAAELAALDELRRQNPEGYARYLQMNRITEDSIIDRISALQEQGRKAVQQTGGGNVADEIRGLVNQ